MPNTVADKSRRFRAYKDNFHKIIESRGINRAAWYQLAQNRETWREIVAGKYESPQGNPEETLRRHGGTFKCRVPGCTFSHASLKTYDTLIEFA